MAIFITSRTEGINFAYEKYLRKDYIVNRKYQRKLVWSLKEKEALIDSLFSQYSIPLFLFAEEGDGPNKRYEIIDGMQRLNAIFSFIENDYPVFLNGAKGYFNLDTLPDTLRLKNSGVLKQKTPILPREDCGRMTNYPLSISIISANDKDIETVFRRINSYGRQLSEQEIRLAGAVGNFPDLVRKISATIRGDVSSSDRMTLNDMRKISLSYGELKYGIPIGKTFWVRNNIIIPEAMRTSRDEELVSHILAYILLGKDTPPSRKTLDDLYQYNERSDKLFNINDKINRYGMDKLHDDFIKVHNILRLAIDKSKTDLRSLLYKNEITKSFFRAYQILFLAVFKLAIDEDKNEINYDGFVRELEGLGTREFSSLDIKNWKAHERTSKIDAVCGIIGKYFLKSKHKDVARENWIQQLDSLLTRSMTEGTQYDFKTGCYDLNNGSFSKGQVKKWIKTLTAQVNIPNVIGYVIVGVADAQDTANKVKNTYNVNFRTHPNGKFFITGIEGEIKKYHNGNEDAYLQKIKQVIRETNVDSKVQQQILTSINLVNYYDHQVLILQLKSGSGPYMYDGKIYIREGNECIEKSKPEDILAIVNAFNK